MINFFTHWTKKKVIICIVSVVLAGTAVFGAFTFLGPSGGTTDVAPPDNTNDGTSLRPADKTVADYVSDPKQNLYIANGVLAEAGSFRSTSTGTTVSTKVGFSVTQDILATRVVKGSTVYKKSSSYGLVKMGDERLAHGDKYLYRLATKVNSVSDMDWPNDAPTELSKEEFVNRYGQRGNGLTGYILNDETIVSATFDGYDEQSGLYTFTYVLDNQKATAYMLYEMRTNSGSKNFATFQKAVITVSMDANWVVHTLTTDCEYNVPIAGGTPCKESMTEVFSDIGQIESFEQIPCYDFYRNYVDFSVAPPSGDNDGELPAPVLPSEPAEPEPLDVLMNMFEGYLEGAPLNARLSTQVGGLPIEADVTLVLNLQDLAKTTFSALTANGLQVAYANDNIFAAVNDVKLRSSVDGIVQAISRFANTQLPSIDLDFDNLDTSALMDAMTLDFADGKAVVGIELNLGQIAAKAEFVGTEQVGGKYAFQSATVDVGGIELQLFAQDKTIELLSTDEGDYVDACAVLLDYADVFGELFSVRSDSGELLNKSWLIDVQPLSLMINGTTYQTEQMQLRLYSTKEKVVLNADNLCLTCTYSDGTTSTKQLAFGGALTFANEQSPSTLYLTINDLVNPSSDLKFSIGLNALTDCVEKRLPELKEAIPQLGELLETDFDVANLLKLSSLLSHLSYDRNNGKTLTLSVDASPLLTGLGKLDIMLSQPQDGQVRLSVRQSDETAVTIGNISVAAKVGEQPSGQTADEAYDVNAAHIRLDSIDTLLQSLVNTAKRTSFRLTGKVPVNLNALSIVKADVELGLDVRIDVEKDTSGKDVVYIAAKISRGELSDITAIAFNDVGGDSYLFYDGANGQITVKRNSLNKIKWCTICNKYASECSNKFVHAGFRSNKLVLDQDYYGKCSYDVTVSEAQFAANPFDYVLPMINFSSMINDAIVGAINEEKDSAYGIDDVLLNYTYSAPTYNVKLDLKPIDSVLGQADIFIDHDENANFTSLYGSVVLLDMSGISAVGTFDIRLVDSVFGDAKSLLADRTLF